MYKFHTAPFEHQKHALRQLIAWDGRGGLLADTGTGKTWCVLNYLGIRADQVGPQLWLVVAPLDVLSVWEAEVARHTPDIEIVTGQGLSGPEKLQLVKNLKRPESGVRICALNYEAFQNRRHNRHLKLRNVCAEAGFDGLVADELHWLKSRSSVRGRTIRALAAKMPRVIGMTGTFIPNDWPDIWGQWVAVHPQSMPKTYTEYCEMYGTFDEIWAPHKGRTVRVPAGCKDWPGLRAQVAQRGLSIRKEECLDLPPLVEQIVPVALSDAERRAYDDLQEKLYAVTDDGTVHLPPGVLARSTSLRQITSGFYTYEDEHGGRSTEVVGDSKMRVLKTLLEGSSRQKIVILCSWLHDVRAATDKAKELGRAVKSVTGEVPVADRVSIRRWFQDTDEPAILVAQVATVAHGINELVAAQEALVVSESTKRAEMVQARDRLHRLGQTGNKVLIRYLIALGTMDEVIHDAHVRRQSVETALRLALERAADSHS